MFIVVSASQAAENIPNNTISGTVLKKEDSVVTIETETGIKDFTVPNDIKITKNQSETNINDIQPKDRVIITTGNNGAILAVDAVGNQISQWQTYLPLAAIILILLGFVLTLLNKKKQGIIKTKPVKFNN
jgi:hypothetical protein